MPSNNICFSITIHINEINFIGIYKSINSIDGNESILFIQSYFWRIRRNLWKVKNKIFEQNGSSFTLYPSDSGHRRKYLYSKIPYKTPLELPNSLQLNSTSLCLKCAFESKPCNTTTILNTVSQKLQLKASELSKYSFLIEDIDFVPERRCEYSFKKFFKFLDQNQKTSTPNSSNNVKELHCKHNTLRYLLLKSSYVSIESLQVFSNISKPSAVKYPILFTLQQRTLSIGCRYTLRMYDSVHYTKEKENYKGIVNSPIKNNFTSHSNNSINSDIELLSSVSASISSSIEHTLIELDSDDNDDSFSSNPQNLNNRQKKATRKVQIIDLS